MKTKLILLFFIIATVVYAQEGNIIELRDFGGGVFTNCDFEDLNLNYSTELKNLRPINGKIVKTYSYGDIGYPASDSLINLFTYINDELDSGYVYYAIKIDSVTNQVYLRQYNYSSWIPISLSETFYQKYAVNPIVYGDGIVRILPGNKDSAGTEQCKGIWIGYIDRKFFDEHYAPSAGFSGYPTEIEIFDIKNIDTLTFEPYNKTAFDYNDINYYKFSYIYDGIQESLLSDMFKWDVDLDSNRAILFKIPIEESSHSKRITGMNIYRSDDYADGTYNKIHSIDFLRTDDDFWAGDSGAYAGKRNFFIPGLATFDFAGADTVNYFWISINDSTHTKEIQAPSNGDTMFTIGTGQTNMSTAGGWNSNWQLDGIAGTDTFHNLTSGTDGGYGGNAIYILNEPISEMSITSSYLSFGDWEDNWIMEIEEGFNRVIEVFSNDTLTSTDVNNKSWRIFNINKGIYAFKDVATNDSVNLYFIDDGLTEGAEHSLAGEVSININGEFAKIIAGRLWQANLILDPAGKSEIQTNWVSYSELNQYDVNPVSNIITFANVGYGEITGILELFGNPVILKKQSIIVIGVKNYPNNPENWNVIESAYNIGNIAKFGSINVLGNIYIIYYDGIYRFSPNNLAESALTPSEKLKISEPINDVYESLSLSQKENIIVQYDQSKNEIIYTLGDEIWVYSISKNYWRELDSDIDIDFTYLSQDANALVYDSEKNKVYSFDVKDTVSVELKTKTFAVSEDERTPINIISVTYKSSSDLTLNLFSENSDTVRVAKTLPANSKVETIRFGNWNAVYKFALGIIDSVNSNTNSEIHKLRVEF